MKIYSKTFLKDLLIINTLQNTDRDNPKTSRTIIREVEEKLHELFPDDFPKPKPESKLKPETKQSKQKQVTSTVSRHIHDMNLLGDLYKIGTYEGNKLGHYNENEGKKFAFTPAEFALIAIALYRTPSVSTEETKTLLKKFETHMGITGNVFNMAIVRDQIKKWQGVRRKTHREILPVISKLLQAIIEEKQISFNLYERSLKYADEKVSLQKRNKTRKKYEDIVITYRVSPYFLAWESDECYLIPKPNTGILWRLGREMHLPPQNLMNLRNSRTTEKQLQAINFSDPCQIMRSVLFLRGGFFLCLGIIRIVSKK